MAKLMAAFCALGLILSVTAASAARVRSSDSGYCHGNLKFAENLKNCQPATANAKVNDNTKVKRKNYRMR